MPAYAMIDVQNKVVCVAVVNNDTAAQELMEALMLDRIVDLSTADYWTNIGDTWEPNGVPSTGGKMYSSRRIRTSEFIDRFTPTEYETICSHTSSLARAFVSRLSSCGVVNLDNSRLRIVIERAATAGIIDPNRVDEILR